MSSILETLFLQAIRHGTLKEEIKNALDHLCSAADSLVTRNGDLDDAWWVYPPVADNRGCCRCNQNHSGTKTNLTPDKPRWLHCIKSDRGSGKNDEDTSCLKQVRFDTVIPELLRMP